MPLNKQADSSKVAFDGNMLEKLYSDELTLHTAQAGQNPHPMDTDKEIKKAYIIVTESPGTAPGTIDIGITGDATKFIAGYSIALTDSGLYDITDQLASTVITAGDVVVFETNGESTTNGKVLMCLVVGPASVQ